MTEQPARLRVLVADERRLSLEPVSEAVRALGHEIVAVEVDIARVGPSTVEHRPDLAVVALHEDTRHALDLISEIVEETTCAVVILAPTADAAFVEEAAERGVFAHLDSMDRTELQGGIRIALERYREWRELLGAFERRARIERAKGVLMARHGLAEREAFERLRREARSARRRLIDVVDELLATEAR